MSWAGLTSNQWISRANLLDAVNTGVLLRKVFFTGDSKWVTKADAASYVFLDTTVPSYAAKASNQWITPTNVTAASCIQLQLSGVYLGTTGLIIEVYITETLPTSVSFSVNFCVDNGCHGSVTFTLPPGVSGSHTTFEFDTNSFATISGTYASGSVSTIGSGVANQIFFLYNSTTTVGIISDSTRCYQTYSAEYAADCYTPFIGTVCLNCVNPT